MNDSPCGQLDEYLGGELTRAGRPAFEAHLVICRSCRDEVEAFARLKRLLESSIGQEPCPPELVRRIEAQIRAAPDRRPVRSRMVLGVTAAALCITAWLTLDSRHEQPIDRALPRPAAVEPVVDDRAQASNPRASEHEEFVSKVQVDFSDEYLGLPIETDDPRMTIIWVYPTTDASTPIELPDSFDSRREL